MSIQQVMQLRFALQQTRPPPPTKRVPAVDSLLFTIVPPEMRIRIYNETLKQPCAIRIQDPNVYEVRRVDPAILRVSKDVYQEAYEEFLRCNVISASATNWRETILRCGGQVLDFRIKLDKTSSTLPLLRSIDREVSLTENVHTIMFECPEGNLGAQLNRLADSVRWNGKKRVAFAVDEAPYHGAQSLCFSEDDLRCESIGCFTLPVTSRKQIWRFEYSGLAQAWQHLSQLTCASTSAERSRYNDLDIHNWPICMTFEECHVTLQDCNARQLRQLITDHEEMTRILHAPVVTTGDTLRQFTISRRPFTRILHSAAATPGDVLVEPSELLPLGPTGSSTSLYNMDADRVLRVLAHEWLVYNATTEAKQLFADASLSHPNKDIAMSVRDWASNTDAQRLEDMTEFLMLNLRINSEARLAGLIEEYEHGRLRAAGWEVPFEQRGNGRIRGFRLA